MAVFYTRDALSVWTNLGKHSLFAWLFVGSIRTGTRRIIRLDKVSSVVRLERHTTKDYSSRRIITSVCVYKDGQQTDDAEICARVTESQRLYSKENKIASTQASTSGGPRKQQKCRPWTGTELKYFANVLADEKN